MPDPQRDDERRAALEAVWGRAASAAAPPVPRPVAASTTGSAPSDRTRWRSPWLVAIAGPIALLVVVSGVVVATRDGGERGVPAEPDGSTTTLPSWEPGWTVPVSCSAGAPSDEITTRCLVATDDERVFAFDHRADPADEGSSVPTLVAVGVADGREDWAVALPGALTVERLPSVVVVRTGNRTQGIDPARGVVLWTREGLPVGDLGPGHLLIDDESDAPDGLDLRRVSVIEATTGAIVLSLSDAAAELYLHPCGEAGLVLASQDGRLTAHEVADGAVRWSVAAAHHDGTDPVVCGRDVVVELQGGGLVARAVGTGELVGSVPLAPPADDRVARLRGVVSGTVVVEAERLQGFAADATLAALWDEPLPDPQGPVVLEPAGGGVAFGVPADRAGWYGPDGAAGAQVPLAPGAGVVIDGGWLVTWGTSEVLVAAAAEVSRARRFALDGIDDVAVGTEHIAVQVADEVRLYPLEL